MTFVPKKIWLNSDIKCIVVVDFESRDLKTPIRIRCHCHGASRLKTFYLPLFQQLKKYLNEKSHKSSKEINEVRVKSRHVEFRQQQTEPIKKEREPRRTKTLACLGPFFLESPPSSHNTPFSPTKVKKSRLVKICKA